MKRLLKDCRQLRMPTVASALGCVHRPQAAEPRYAEQAKRIHEIYGSYQRPVVNESHVKRPGITKHKDIDMDTKVSMADLISCWKENTGQDSSSAVLEHEKSQEFFSYSLEHLDAMIDQIRKKQEKERQK